MLEKPKEILDLLFKTPISLLVSILLVLSIILFSPISLAKIFYVDSFREQHRIIIGPGFLLVLTILISRILNILFEWINTERLMKKQCEILHELTPSEIQYLKPYILNQETTQYFDIQDGIAGSLDAKNIIYKGSSIGNLQDGFAYNLQPWARKYLMKKLEIFDI